MANVRKKKNSNFTPLFNALLQDSNLSFSTRGMMAYLLSKPTDWESRPSDIERHGNIGKDARRRMMIEAEAAGYLTFHTARKSNGQFESWYDAHEEPVHETERTRSWETGKAKLEPGADNPQAVEADEAEQPGTENPQAVEGEENGQPGAGLPGAVQPAPGSTGGGKPAPLIKTDVLNTDLEKKERESAPVSPAVNGNGNHTDNGHPFDTVTEGDVSDKWTLGQRFILKACDLWDKPVIETDWKVKTAVKENGKWVDSHLSAEKHIGGTPALFREFWFSELSRKVNPRPDYVVEQWDAYDRWLIENHEQHRQEVI